MANRYALGPKIRAARRRLHLTQTQLAKQLGISPSYLNLIEHNRRTFGIDLLIRMSEILPINFKSLTTDDQERTTTDLLEVFGDPLFDSVDIIAQDAREFANTYPAIAESVIRLYGAFRDARQSTHELAETISQDATRSETFPSARFPNEELADLIQARMNYFPELEHGAEVLRKDARLTDTALFTGLAAHLERTAGVKVVVEDERGMNSAVRSYDPDRKVLLLSEGLRRGSRKFQLAYQIGLLTERPVIDRLAADSMLTTDESRTACRVALANYFAAAVLMPYDRFLAAARHVRYDIELLGHQFDTSFEQTCHRLATLRRPGSEGIPFHMLRVDIAGNLSKRFSASGLRIPRFSGACPRWNTFRAFLTPGIIRTQLSQMPDGQLFFGVSRTVRKESGGFMAARSQYAIGLGCAVEHAREMIYADGLDLTSADAAVTVGPSCRLCERMDCEDRAYPPLHHAITVDENRRGASFYAPPPPLK